MDIIRLLSDSIANQIAAGEVVQRPASVVKELLENAIDADAKNIQLIVKEAGKLLIQVIDDGTGMSHTDARMSFERHATSKIRESADLFAIKTMGFRGEALASIAAVAQVELKSRRNEDELGTFIRIEGSEIKEQEFIQNPKGTNLLIKNLFFNVPARRNFLKNNSIEMKHILEEFQRIALAHASLSFSLYHNDVEIYALHASKLSKRIVDVLDKSYREQLADCVADTPMVKISGYVGKPQAASKRRGDQFFFVNNRFIKSPYLNHAVTSAFEATIAQGTHPFYVLFIEIDPSHIDINIHPTKTEIKFDDEKAIYAILRSAVKQAIGVYNITPSIDFESDINFGNLSRPMPSFKTEATSPFSSIRNFEKGNFQKHDLNEKSNASNWQKLFDGTKNRSLSTFNDQYENTLTFGSKVNDITNFSMEHTELSELNVMQIHQKYILAQVKSGLMIIDQQNAFERIYYEKYLKEINSKPGVSQQLLFPKPVTLSAIDYEVSFEIIDMIRNLGFNVEEFGQNTYLINGIPPQFMDEDECQVFKSIIEQYRINENNQRHNKKEILAKTLAKRNATNMTRIISKTEISGLINQLFNTAMPAISPDGKQTMCILNLNDLAELILN